MTARHGSAPDSAPLAEFAAAKVNLTLRVLGRRCDGYHDIESLVAFASVGDRLELAAAGATSLTLGGPFAGVIGPPDDNLVLKAVRALAERVEGLRSGAFALTKSMPVAAGLGGGSADAAAALRLLARLNGLSLVDERLLGAAAATGADVSVCLASLARIMRGKGELLSEPLRLPGLAALLVNPGVGLSTREVFHALGLEPQREGAPQAHPVKSATSPQDRTALLAFIERGGNDLERAAIGLLPLIADLLAALRALKGVEMVRMSGSGATCFAIFKSLRAANDAARQLRAAHADWWICPARLG